MNLKEFIYLIRYALASWFYDGVEFISMLKKARTWSYMLYGTIIVALYYNNLKIVYIVLPLVFILYIVRQSKETKFNRDLKEKSFLENDEQKIKSYYETYKKQCFFSHPKREPLEYEDYKKYEINKINERKSSEEFAS